MNSSRNVGNNFRCFHTRKEEKFDFVECNFGSTLGYSDSWKMSWKTTLGYSDIWKRPWKRGGRTRVEIRKPSLVEGEVLAG